MSSGQPNYAFVDNENVNVSVQKQKWKIDRGKFRERLRTERKVEVAYMFMGYLEEYQPMYEFFTSLGYELIFRPMNPNPDIPNKGNIDTDLVLQAMIDFPNYQQAVIVSGDGDFASLIAYLNKLNKLATVIVPNERRYSGFLNEASGEKIVSLNNLKNILRYKPSGKKKEETGPSKTPGPTQTMIKYTPKTYTKKSPQKLQHSKSQQAKPQKAKLPQTSPVPKKQLPQQTKPTQPKQSPPASQQTKQPSKHNKRNGRPNSKPRHQRSSDDTFYA